MTTAGQGTLGKLELQKIHENNKLSNRALLGYCVSTPETFDRYKMHHADFANSKRTSLYIEYDAVTAKMARNLE